MDRVKRFEVEGGAVAVEIYVDPDPENPRDAWDNFGTMWCWHRRYQLGSEDESRSKGVDPRDYGGWEELKEAIVTREKPAVILPVFMYEHSGMCLNTTGWDCPWDSGQVGFIFVSRRKILENYGKKRLTRALIERAEAALREEVEVYSAYAEGNVYGWRTFKNEQEDDSCWGYYGDDAFPVMLQEALGKDAERAVEVR